MRIGGFMPFTLSDYPGLPAAVVFTQGCNFRCPFCHNGDLLSAVRPQSQLIPEETVFELLKKRGGRLQGVVITGG
ncbi:MAG TPA: radical SAM protein [Kiritimatiellia bacterium]|nr:radical SAM protein [Kiritimatiellia bacterium]